MLVSRQPSNTGDVPSGEEQKIPQVSISAPSSALTEYKNSLRVYPGM